jgi:hemerythrin-like metal-binding protein
MSHLNQAFEERTFGRSGTRRIIGGAQGARRSFMPTAEGRKDIPGLPEMEREHELQIALVDAFERAAGANERIEAGKILEEMADLSEMHFLAEELVMRLHQYPALEEHAAEHARLIQGMNELLRQNAAGTLEITLALARRLRHTLTNHLRGTDHALAVFMRREGAATKPPEAPPS